MPASRVALPLATARNAPAPSFFSLRSSKKRVPMPCAFASRSTDSRYAAIVSTLGGSAVNQRATLLPKVCARAALRSMPLGAPNSRKLASRVGRFASDLNAGSANVAAPAAASRLSAAARRSVSASPTSAMPSVRGLSRRHSRIAFAAQVKAAKRDAAAKVPTVRPVARAFAARVLRSSSSFFVARRSSVASCLPYGRRASAPSLPRAATMST